MGGDVAPPGGPRPSQPAEGKLFTLLLGQSHNFFLMLQYARGWGGGGIFLL